MPSMPGIFQSMTTSSNGLSLSALSISSSASLPDAARKTSKENDSRISCKISREVALSSTTSTFNPRRSDAGTKRLFTVSFPIPKSAVKWKVVPLPDSLSIQISPPIIFTRRLLMVSPKPVPPYLRVVEVSAWEKAWNSLACCSGVMPMPVSRTENCRVTLSSDLFDILVVTTISPFSVNFIALFPRLTRI